MTDTSKYTHVAAGIVMLPLMFGALAPSVRIDHRSGDGLDNRKGNLRRATALQNMQNRSKRIGASPFKGVCLDKTRWRASITVDGRRKNLGHFETQDEAALAYDSAARDAFADFARLNFPNAGETGAIRK